MAEICCGDGVCAEGIETAVYCEAACARPTCSSDGECAETDTPFCVGGACVECTSNAQGNDGLFCTAGDVCVAGTCVAGASDPCCVGETCSEATDTCESTAPGTVTGDFPNCCCDNALSTS